MPWKERLWRFLAGLGDREKRPFLAHVLHLGGGTAVGQFVVVLSAPILTRLYTPQEMGLFSLIMAFIGLASVATGLRFETAIVSAQDEQEAGLLTWASLLSALPVAVVFGLLLWLLVRFDLLSYGKLPLWSIPVTVLLLIITQLFLSLRYWYVKQSRFPLVAKVLVAQGCGRAVAPCLAGLAGFGWSGLLLGEVAGRMLGIHRMLAEAWGALSGGPRDWGLLGRTCRKYWKFPAVAVPSSFIEALGPALVVPIIAMLYGTAEAGLFFLVTRLGTLPSSFISASIADVFHARISEDYRTDPARLRPFLVRTAKRLGVFGALIYVPVALASPFLLPIIFGRPWALSGVLMSIVAPVAVAGLVVSPLSRLLFVVTRQELKLIADVTRVCLPLLSLAASWHLRWDFRGAVLGYSVVTVIGDGVYFLLLIIASTGSAVGASRRNVC